MAFIHLCFCQLAGFRLYLKPGTCTPLEASLEALQGCSLCSSPNC